MTSHLLFMQIKLSHPSSAGKKMAEAVTPKKPVRSSFSSSQKCAVCGSFLDDPRKRVKLKKDLALKLQEIIASENLDPEGYLCNNNSYKSVNRYFELKAMLESLKTDLTQKFENEQGQSVRWKQELPSDVSENENSSAKASRPNQNRQNRRHYTRVAQVRAIQ